MQQYSDSYGFNVKNKKGSTRKIEDFTEKKGCKDTEHNPPQMIVLEPGTYEHECPSCGNIQVFTVEGYTCLQNS